MRGRRWPAVDQARTARQGCFAGLGEERPPGLPPLGRRGHSLGIELLEVTGVHETLCGNSIHYKNP